MLIVSLVGCICSHTDAFRGIQPFETPLFQPLRTMNHQSNLQVSTRAQLSLPSASPYLIKRIEGGKCASRNLKCRFARVTASLLQARYSDLLQWTAQVNPFDQTLDHKTGNERSSDVDTSASMPTNKRNVLPLRCTARLRVFHNRGRMFPNAVTELPTWQLTTVAVACPAQYSTTRRESGARRRVGELTPKRHGITETKRS
jgi:hypothetical protein